MSIKSIKEKELLVNFARAMGQAVDPKLAEEVDRINAIRNSVRASVSENIFKDLGAAVTNYEPDDGPLTEVQLEQIKETVQIEFPKPPSLDELLLVLNEQIEEVKNELVQTQPEKESPETETSVPDTTEPVAEQTLADRTSEFLSKSRDSFQQPDPLAVAPDMDAITKKLRFLEQWISKVSMAGPGSGETKFARLDDVNRSTIGDTHKVMRYFPEENATYSKFGFGNLSGDQGPIYSMQYDTTGYTSNANVTGGLTAWNNDKDCLDIHQKDGSILQVGLENYILVWNNSPNVLPNGTFVSLNTITSTINEVPACQPYLANAGSFPYFTLGLLTNDVAPNTIGRATVLGEVHDLNTTGNIYGETWALGDILWANPSIPGGLTNIRPTAPNVVVTVGKVVTRDATDGMILVRPTVLPHFYYGTFISTVTQQAANVNYPNAIRYDFSPPAGPVTGQSGFHLASNSRIVSEVTGLFNYQFSLQVSSGNASAKNIYIWPRINGVDVPNSATRLTFTSTGDSVAAWNFILSMIPGRYFELMFAVDDTNLYLDAPAATSFCPAIPSMILTVTQVNS
jgi:hypothetical protein